MEQQRAGKPTGLFTKTLKTMNTETPHTLPFVRAEKEVSILSETNVLMGPTAKV